MEISYRKRIKEAQQKKRTELSRKYQKLNHPRKGQCNFVFPIKSIEHIGAMKSYLFKKSARDYLLFILGINNGLRTGDLLKLKVKDLKDLKAGDSIKIKEGKTKQSYSPKASKIAKTVSLKDIRDFAFSKIKKKKSNG